MYGIYYTNVRLAARLSGAKPTRTHTHTHTCFLTHLLRLSAPQGRAGGTRTYRPRQGKTIVPAL